MMIRAMLIATALLGTAGAHAASQYRVDVIVFKNEATPNGSPDEASAAIRQFAADGIRFGNREELRAAGVIPLSEDNTQLATEWSRLRNARAFIPYVRAAWVQPGVGPARAPSVRLNDGVTVTIRPTPQRRYVSELFAGDESSTPDDGPETMLESADRPSPPPNDTGDSMAAPSTDALDLPDAEAGDGSTLEALELTGQRADAPVVLDQLDGTVQLYAQRYLHLNLDLWWTQHADGLRVSTGETLDEADARIFHIAEQRRIRIGELHYFDHPRFGVLAIVTRAE